MEMRYAFQSVGFSAIPVLVTLPTFFLHEWHTFASSGRWVKHSQHFFVAKCGVFLSVLAMPVSSYKMICSFSHHKQWIND
jgi:hypothetical protein